MKTVIIEDEKPAARKLERMLITNGLDVVTTLHSVETSVIWFQENPHPPIVFSDIQLGDGLSFEIFETVKLKESFIIFTTAYDQYTLRAFKLNSIDYLLKPVNERELKMALEKFKQIHPQKEESFLELFEQVFTQKQTYKERFLVKVGDFLKPIYVKDISCFFSENKTTYLQVGERGIPIDFALEELDNLLNPDFFRINRQSIVHLKYIKEIVMYSGSRLKIKMEGMSETFIVSREKVKEFKLWLGK